MEIPKAIKGLDLNNQHNSCRLCGLFPKDSSLIDIFSSDSDLYEQIHYCFVNINIQKCDRLSHKVCQACAKNVGVCYEFIRKVVETQRVLTETRDLQLKRIKYSSFRLRMEVPMTCEFCDQDFMDLNTFDSHILEHKETMSNVSAPKNIKISIVCTDCYRAYPTRALFQAHKNVFFEICGKCSQVVKSQCDLHVHKCARFICSLCPELSFVDQDDLHSHFNKVHCFIVNSAVADVKCLQCSGKFLNWDTLMENHSCIKSRFKNLPQNVFKQHSNIVKVYFCGHCGAMTEKLDTFENHIQGHKPPTETKFKCTGCSKSFSTLSKLRSHYSNTHDTQNSLNEFYKVCKYCGKALSSQISLDAHERIHTGARPYVCEWCGLTFRSKPNLNQHHLTHTGIKKHPCLKCGKKFARKSFVELHMRTHTGEKPYSCNICGQKFSQVGDMKRHHQRHSAKAEQPGTKNQ